MYLGRIVESGPSAAIFGGPRHPYTQALLGAVPEPDVRGRRELVVLPGNVPSPANPPPGCRFHTRCPLVQDICRREEPPLRALGEGDHLAACHFVLAVE
jgi:oligopeptide/dipeptide ABC transporter ATP-binding protein